MLSVVYKLKLLLKINISLVECIIKLKSAYIIAPRYITC